MSENINFDLKREGSLAVFKLNESKLEANIAGIVKGELTILLHTEEIDKLILDLSEVDYCDSSGLSAILLAYRILQSSEGHIRLAALSPSVKSLIEISQLDRILPVCETVEQAEKQLKEL